MGRNRMHGQFPHSLDEKLVDKELSYRWLKFGDINSSTPSDVQSTPVI
jgi:hypothetical protein